MIFTSEYVYNNPKLNEINNITKNTQLKYEQKDGYNYYRKVDVKCNVIFYDKIKKTKNIIIERENIFGEVNKIMQSSKRVYKFIRALDLIIIIPGIIYENVENMYLRCDNIPILWKKFFLKIANDREFVSNRFILDCRERHFLNI